MAAGTGIRQGGSLSRDPALAACEVHNAIAQPDPGLTVFFRSTPYDLDALACEIGRRFGHAHVFGCANAGEIGPAGYLANAIAGFSLPAADCCAASELIPEISALRMQQGHAAAQAAVTALARPDARSEDQLRHAAQQRDVHRRGGAARLDPRAAGIISTARRLGRRRSAVAAHLRLSRGALPPRRGAANAGRHAPPFRIASCHRFRGSGTRMVVTRAAPATRTVSEINAEPAADEYARIAGLPRRPDKGLGLGLAIVERIARLLSPDVEVWSRVGRGSCLVLALQRALGWTASSLMPAAPEHGAMTRRERRNAAVRAAGQHTAAIPVPRRRQPGRGYKLAASRGRSRCGHPAGSRPGADSQRYSPGVP